MSFTCDFCNKSQTARTKPVRVVTAKRRKSYPERAKGKKVFDPGGAGEEIVSEADICESCAAKRSSS